MLLPEKGETMAYTVTNYKTKKALKEAFLAHVERGLPPVNVYQPGPFGPDVKDGSVCLEGPHYPEAHKWYASAEIRDGIVVKLK